MNLFNIGVDGQYRLAAFFAAAVRRRGRCSPGPLHVAVDRPGRDGGRRALGRHRGRAQGHPRRQRGHLDDHAELRSPARSSRYLLRTASAYVAGGSNNIAHQADPGRPACPASRSSPAPTQPVYGFIVVAVAGRRRLLVRCSAAPASASTCGPPGCRESAAVASGVNVKRMVVSAMLLSGAVAGLVGMPSCSATPLLQHRTSRPGSASPASRSRCSGRNNPVGIAFGALLWAFLDQPPRSSTSRASPKEIVTIMQGVIVLSRGRRLRARPPLPAGASSSARRPRSCAARPGAARPHEPRRDRRCTTRRGTPRRRAGASGRRRPRPAASLADRWPASWSLLSLVRVHHRRRRLTSGGHASRPRSGLAVPIALAGLGGLWSERAGVVNIGLEGMMILGTWGGALGRLPVRPWAGSLAGVAVGALGGLLHARRDRHLRRRPHRLRCRDQHPRRSASRQYLSNAVSPARQGGGADAVPAGRATCRRSPCPGCRDGLPRIESTHWFLVSDLAGILRGAGHQPVAADAARGAAGRRHLLRAVAHRRSGCGCAPAARTRSPRSRSASTSTGTSTSPWSSPAGSPGSAAPFLAWSPSHIYQEGQTGGRGYIGLAAMIFGNWRPGGLAVGRRPVRLHRRAPAAQRRRAVHALLLLLAIVLAGRSRVAAACAGSRRRAVRRRAVVGASLLLVWYLMTDEVPRRLHRLTPYVVTLLVLALAAQRLRMPKADGLRYRRAAGRDERGAGAGRRLGRRCGRRPGRSCGSAYAPYSRLPGGRRRAGRRRPGRLGLQRRERGVRRRAVRRVRPGLRAARHRRRPAVAFVVRRPARRRR